MLFFTVYKYSAKVQIKSKTTKNNVISPAGASLQLVPNSEFTILSLSHQSHNCPYIPSLLSLPIPPTSPILPTRPTCRTRPTIHNSEFKIHNLPIPLALFRVHYRLKKLFSLWQVKRNSRVVLLYYGD